MVVLLVLYSVRCDRAVDYEEFHYCECVFSQLKPSGFSILSFASALAFGVDPFHG